MAIRILATGGTFDKEYNERTGQLYFKDTHVAEMLRLGRSQVEVRHSAGREIDQRFCREVRTAPAIHFATARGRNRRQSARNVRIIATSKITAPAPRRMR